MGGMTTTAPEDVAWDLEPLVDGEGEAGADRLLDDAERRATAFAHTHAGKVADLDGPGLAAAMAELAAIADTVGRVGSYAALRFSTDTADPANGALLQRVQERGTTIETTLLFFELEWAALDDDQAEELLAAEGLGASEEPQNSAGANSVAVGSRRLSVVGTVANCADKRHVDF